MDFDILLKMFLLLKLLNQLVTTASTASPTNTINVSVAETLVYIWGSEEKDKGKSIMQESEPPRKVKKRVQE